MDFDAGVVKNGFVVGTVRKRINFAVGAVRKEFVAGVVREDFASRTVRKRVDWNTILYKLFYLKYARRDMQS